MYNGYMMKKRRCDRNHVIYCLQAETGEQYVGLTVADGSAFLRSVKVRVQKHLSRARKEDKSWALYDFLRSNPEVPLTYEVLEVVRGRKPAHQRERQLISEMQPVLNTF
jgi:Uri superfamily endonuclease